MKIVPFIHFCLFTLSIVYLTSTQLHAQELPPPSGEFPIGAAVNPASLNEFNQAGDDFLDTSTQVDNEEDDSEVRDEDLFKNSGNEESLSNGETHLLRFEFNGSVQFMPQEKNNRGEPISGEPYLEVNYQLVFETPIELGTRKQTIKLETDMDIDHWGSFAKNEYFDCQLDIDMAKIPVEISTQLQNNNLKQNNDEDVEEMPPSLILKISVDQSVRENWFSLCTDFGGTSLNTQGESEDYHSQLLKMIDPSLSGIVIDSFDSANKTIVELASPQKIINDLDIQNDLSLSGQGQISIDPL